ncbi:hypothetical protein ACN4EE_21825 [Geminocystis sp. CENA526]|uniref:hypothetical protein n=1 Tax=Geminocystis sp. CENA526 TaxID=1355871 RepID=UPI003D6F9C8D
MTTINKINSKISVLTILVISSQIFAVNNRVIAQSIPQISISNISSPVIPVTTPNVAIPTVKVTTTNNIPSTSLISQPVTPTVNITTTNNIPSTSLQSQPVIPTAVTPTVNVTTTNNIPSTSLISQPVIPTVNVTTTNNIPSTSLINSPTPVIPTVNVSFNDKGLPLFANYDGNNILTNIPSILDLKPLTFSVTGNEDNTEPSFLNDKGSTGVGSTNIAIPQPTPPLGGGTVTVSTINVVFPSSQQATGISSNLTNTETSFNLQVNFTPPVLD